MECAFKSVIRAMREGRPYPKTSDGEGRGSWPNPLAGNAPTGPGQAWVADITYIGMPGGFAYLACVLDRTPSQDRGLGHERNIDDALTETALRNALANMKPKRVSSTTRTVARKFRLKTT